MVSRNRIILIGAGGHARILIDLVGMSEAYELIGLLDNDRNKWGQSILGIPVLGDDNLLNAIYQNKASHFAIAIGGPRQSHLRQQLFHRAQESGLIPTSLIHQTSTVSPWAEINDGVQLLAHSVVNASAKIGCNSIINTAAVVEHDCTLEPHVHLAPRACLAGGVHVGQGAHIGLGAVVKENSKIGAGAMIGAGAVVINDVLPGETVVGVPARPLARKEAA